MGLISSLFDHVIIYCVWVCFITSASVRPFGTFTATSVKLVVLKGVCGGASQEYNAGMKHTYTHSQCSFLLLSKAA